MFLKISKSNHKSLLLLSIAASRGYPSSKRKVQWRGSLAVCARRVRAQERLKDSSTGPETSSRTPLHALFLVRHVPWLGCTCKPSGSKFNSATSCLRAFNEP